MANKKAQDIAAEDAARRQRKLEKGETDDDQEDTGPTDMLKDGDDDDVIF